MQCRFIMLDLKQKFSQNSKNELVPHVQSTLSCFHLLARLCWLPFLGDSRAIIKAHFMPKGRTVTARYYSEVTLTKKKKKEKKKKKRKLKEKLKRMRHSIP